MVQKATKLRFLLKSTESPMVVFSRFHPNGKTVLNTTEWRGKPPRSCGITNVRTRSRSAASNDPVEWEIEVECRPKGYISYVAGTKYDAWTAMMLDRQKDGTLLDGHGKPLPEGQAPVYLPFEVHKDVEFNEIEFGEFLGETEVQDVNHVQSAEVMQMLASANSVNMSVNAKFVAPRRHRPEVKIILSDADSGEGIDGFGTRIININNSTPHLEQVLLDKLTELVSGYVEGRYSMKTLATDDFAFAEINDALVDCTPNQHGLESWFDVLKNYVPGAFLDELAKRLMATYEVEVNVVDGEKPGLLLRRLHPDSK